MKCLRCGDQELELQVRGEDLETFEIDHCAACGGLWLDHKELSRLDDNFFLDVEDIEFDDSEATEQDQALTCPRCDGAPQLKKVHPAGFEQLVLDTCPGCHGFWLDKGGLEQMRDVSDRMLIASLMPPAD